MQFYKKFNKRSNAVLTTLIAQGTEIAGDVRFSGNMEVEGAVQGNLIALDSDAGTIRVMHSGCVQGDVHVPNVVLNGRVIGDVYASKYLELACNAVVEGNVHYNVLEMVRGAQINGKLIYTDGENTEPAAEQQSIVTDADRSNDSVIAMKARVE